MRGKSKEERAEIRRLTEAAGKAEKDRTPHTAARGPTRGKRSSQRSLSHLSRKELDDDEFLYAIESMRKGSDRETAIIGAALVEDVLREIIAAYLERPDDKNALFHDQSAPFHTFKSMIVSAYAMGFGTSRLMADIDRIREIRNQFSHALRPITFLTEDIADYCAGLDSYEIAEQSGAMTGDIDMPRHRFAATCETIWIKLTRELNAFLQRRASEMEARVRQNAAILQNSLLFKRVTGSD